MLFTYELTRDGLEGVWDSASEETTFNFFYTELPPEREVHVAPRREAHLRQSIPNVSVDFVSLEQDLKNDPESLLAAHKKLCLVQWQQAIPFVPAEYDQVVSGAGHLRMPFPTEHDYYESKVMGELHKAARAITNYYLSSMVRPEPVPKTPG